MRIQDIFTIKSQYPKRGFYWIFKTSDPVCLVSYQGKVGEVSKDRPAMLAIDLPEVKVGFTETDSSFKKGWWAPPTVVKTDRLVLITKDGRIKQSEKDFPDKREYATVIFNDSFDAKMLDATRTLVLAGLGLIPEVGGAVKWVVGSVWPEQKPTVEDLISEAEARMKAWVHGKINDYERRELTSRLAGLRRNLEEYTRARDPGARKRWFDTCLALFNYSRDFFVKDTIEDYTPGTIELAFKLATMHLSLLRERVVHTSEIYGKETVELAAHKKDLKEGIADYQKFIKDVAIPGEIKWREEMIETTDIPPDILGQAATIIKDYSARQVQGFYRGQGRYGGDHTVLVDYYQRQALHSYETALQANVGDPAMLWTLLDPDQANARPIAMDRVWWVGPCTGLLEKLHNEHGADRRVQVDDKPGLPKKIYVREYNEVDFLQFYYEGHDGKGAGNPRGGEAHTIEIPTGVFIDRIETWWDWELSGIKFHFTNGRDTGLLGNRTGIGKHVEYASYPGHRLSAIRIEGHGGEGGVAKNAMSFGFSPMPNYYDPKP